MSGRLQHHVLQFVRYSSTSAKSGVSAQKMRDLVTLYHQADSFITEDNLSQAIDNAFIGNDKSKLVESVKPAIPHAALKQYLGSIRKIPKYQEWDDASSKVTRGADWSASTALRQQRVIEALYGVNFPSTGDNPKPGYDSLMELIEEEEHSS